LQKLSAIQEGLVLVIAPPPVRGIGTAGGFRMMVEDRAGRGPEALQAAVFAMTSRAAQTPGLRQVFSLFESSTPQLYLDIDRTKAQMLGINVAEVFGALQTYIGSYYVNDFNLLGRTFRVTAQAEDAYRLDPKDVLQIRVRNASGDTVPIGSFTTVSDMTGPYRAPHYNLYPAAELDGAPSPGYSQGQAIQIMEKLAAETLPAGFTYEWTTLAFQQMRAGNTSVFAFALAVVFVFLVLAAQYESMTLPLAVILIVPMCLIASITGILLRGQDNNILTQVGFIVLIATFNQSILLQSLPEAADIGWGRRPDAQETDPAGLHLLRRRSLRLCNHRASEQNDELPPPHRSPCWRRSRQNIAAQCLSHKNAASQCAEAREVGIGSVATKCLSPL
jgi:multidrug efflux pump subunit AcrB